MVSVKARTSRTRHSRKGFRGTLPDITQTPSKRTLFGSLQTQISTRATEYAGGERLAMYELNWREWEVTRGELDSAKTATHVANVAALIASGFKVTLGVGLHYKPTWYNTLGGAGVLWKKNQLDEVATGLTNMVFSQTARNEAARFVGLVNAVLPLSQFHAIRITSGDKSEVMYPENVGTNQYSWWGFDSAAQGLSSDLASGMVPCPWPGWKPGQTLPSGNTGVGPWIDWYLDALIRTVDWQETLYDSLGFRGWYHLVVPGTGVTQNVWTAMHNDTTLLSNNLAGVGAVWERVAALCPRKDRTGLMSSSVANTQSTAYPTLADANVGVQSTTTNSWTPARRIKRFAVEYGLRAIGENAGWNMGNFSSADSANTGAGGLMDRVFKTVTVPGYEFDESYFAHSPDLFNGNIPGGAAAYAGYIAGYYGAQSPPAVPVAPNAGGGAYPSLTRYPSTTSYPRAS